MARNTRRAKGQLTLPEEIRKTAHLEEGDVLEAELTGEGILLRPQKIIDRSQAWYWTPEWRAGAAATLADLGLRLHPDKTKIVCLRHGAEGFDFLGFHHRMVESWKRKGRYYLNKWPSPRAMASIRTACTVR